ncbi:MAG TPA: hypothetical protein VIM65_13680 [Cyclobacteriaceae bacterium]
MKTNTKVLQLSLITWAILIPAILITAFIVFNKKYEHWIIPLASYFILIALYIPVAILNNGLSLKKKILWITGIVIMPVIVIPFYWFSFIKTSN